MVLRTGRRTVTDTDILNFAGVSGDFQPLHTDDLFARTTLFGRRVAHGLLVLSMVTGLRTMANWFVGTTMAFLEIRSYRFLKPVFPGDTIYSLCTILKKEPTSKPDRGVVVQGIEVYNQNDEKVQEGEFVTLLRRKGGSPKG
jgi:acyl dehydratase